MGAGADWTNEARLFVGQSSTGTLTIEDGGEVSNSFGYIGPSTGSGGTVTVTGADGDGNASTWENRDWLYVGIQGTGELTIADGGQVSNSLGIIGQSSGSDGTVTVTGTDGDGNASTWENTSSLRIGSGGTGELTIAEGGQVSNTTGFISSTGGDGTVTVTGTDGEGGASTWTNEGALYVGGDQWSPGGDGLLTVSQGGEVIVNGSTGMTIRENGGVV